MPNQLKVPLKFCSALKELLQLLRRIFKFLMELFVEQRLAGWLATEPGKSDYWILYFIVLGEFYPICVQKF